MKLRHMLLIAVALIIPAGFASATPVGDPSVIINSSPKDATPFTGTFDVTLDPDGGANVVFENALDVDITQLTVQFMVPFPTGVNTCYSDIFSSCGVSFVSLAGKFVTEDFVFSGGSISPDEMFSFSAMGFTGANPNVVISSTPEPATIVLLLTGGLLVIGLGRRQ
ncbi:MAG: PEP-CTERM sorting domain-containing protein [Candidatus Acidiferrales bacterium]